MVAAGVLIPLDVDDDALLAQIAADLDVSKAEAGLILLTSAMLARMED